MPKISSSPSPATFAEAVAKDILAPAATKAAGSDGLLDANDRGRIDALDGTDAHARALLQEAAALTGHSAPTVAAFVAAATERVKRDAAAAAGADGRLSARDAAALPADLRLAYFALRGSSDGLVIPERPGYSFSEAALRDVCARYGISDVGALLDRAIQLDDGNRYLKKSELEAAAKLLNGRAAELGIVSDVDKTVLPPSSSGAPLKRPYPGVAMLYRILESRLDGRGAPGDMHWVTARDANRAAELPAWLDLHRLPAGTIATGTSPLPWVAEPEKIRDIEAIFEASGDQKFVLFGDTNHRDPEVYRAVRDKYPDRVLAIVLHNVKAIDPARTVGEHVVDNYAIAAARLLQDGVIDAAAARAVMEAAQLEGLVITDAEIERLIDDHS